jgi:membrane protease YdiL (CAAX protease family)
MDKETDGSVSLKHRECSSEKGIGRLSVGILVALVLIRILYLGGVRYLTRPDYPEWLLPSEMFATYLLTAWLIYLQRNRLHEFHITACSIVLFITAPIFEPAVSYMTQNWISWPYSALFRIGVLVTAAFLAVFLWRYRHDVRARHDKLSWIALAIVAGILFGLASGFYFEYQQFGRIFVRDVILKSPSNLRDLVAVYCMQMMNAAVMEEPLFRGFLWGYLHARGMSDRRILLVQTLMFSVAHIYYLGVQPFSFWILVPSAGLMFGYLAWKSRSITPSLVAHSIVNSLPGFIYARILYFWW